MNEMSHDELLSAYLDGELTADQQAQVERRLASDPRARQLIDDLRALRATLQDLPEQMIEEDLAPIVLRVAERRMLTEPTEPTEQGEPAQAARATPAQKVRRAFYAVGRRLLNPRGVAWAAAALLVAVLLWMNEKERIRPIAQAPPAGATKETTEREVPAIGARPEPGATAAEDAGEAHFGRSRHAEKNARDNAARRNLGEADEAAPGHQDSDLSLAGTDLESAASGAAARGMAHGAPHASDAGVASTDAPMPGKGAASGLRFGNGAHEHDVRPQAEAPGEAPGEMLADLPRAAAQAPGAEQTDQGARSPAPPVIGKGGIAGAGPTAESAHSQVAQGGEPTTAQGAGLAEPTAPGQALAGRFKPGLGEGAIAKGGPQAGSDRQTTMGSAFGGLAQAESAKQAPGHLDTQTFEYESPRVSGVQRAGGLMLVYCDVNRAGLQNRTLDRVLGQNRIVFDDDADGATGARQSASDQMAHLGTLARDALSRVAGTMGGSDEHVPAGGRSVAGASGVQTQGASQPSHPHRPPSVRSPAATPPSLPPPDSRSAGRQQGQTVQAPKQPGPIQPGPIAEERRERVYGAKSGPRDSGPAAGRAAPPASRRACGPARARDSAAWVRTNSATRD